MQKHTIVIKNFVANTASAFVASSSTLSSFGSYQVNDFQGLGGGIVNSSNVRGFLNDFSNQIIINDFFSYLTGSTTTQEFAEIYNSDQNLANVFNDYYESTILAYQYPHQSILDSSLSGTSGTTIIENQYFNYDGIAPPKYLEGLPLSINEGSRILTVYSTLTTYTQEDSYYIPVFINRNNKQIPQFNFNTCSTVINLLLNPNPNESDLSGLILSDIVTLPATEPVLQFLETTINENDENISENSQVEIVLSGINTFNNSNVVIPTAEDVPTQTSTPTNGTPINMLGNFSIQVL